MFSSTPRHSDRELVAVKKDGWLLQEVNKLALRWELCSDLSPLNFQLESAARTSGRALRVTPFKTQAD